MDYAVDYAVLAQAGHKATGLTADMSATMHDMRLDDVPAAVPGSLSASAAGHVDAKWMSASEELGKWLASYAQALTETATEYRRIEDAAEAAAQRFFGGVG